MVRSRASSRNLDQRGAPSNLGSLPSRACGPGARRGENSVREMFLQSDSAATASYRSLLACKSHVPMRLFVATPLVAMISSKI